LSRGRGKSGKEEEKGEMGSRLGEREKKGRWVRRGEGGRARASGRRGTVES